MNFKNHILFGGSGFNSKLSTFALLEGISMLTYHNVHMVQVSFFYWSKRNSTIPTLLLLFTASMLTCDQVAKDALANFSHQVKDYIHLPGTNSKFSEADSFKYERNYPLCVASFKNVLRQKDLRKDDSIYIFNQMVFACLQMDQDAQALSFLNQLEHLKKGFSEAQKADDFLNQGILFLHLVKPVEAKLALNQALELYTAFYPNHHLRIALTKTALALYYYDYGEDFQLFENTINEAFKCFYPHDGSVKRSALHPFSAEAHFLMAHRYRTIYRDYRPGFNHCMLAEKLIRSAPWQNTKLLARCLGIKGLLLKKEGLFPQADSVICKGMQALMSTQTNHPVIQESYRFLMINAAGRTDVPPAISKSLFEQYENELKFFLTQYKQPEIYAKTAELKAYFFAQKNHANADSSHAACLKVQKEIQPAFPGYTYYHEEMLNLLAQANISKKNYTKALEYQLESFKTSTPSALAQKINSWQDARKLDYNQTKANFFYFHYLAGSIFLNKYKGEGKKNRGDIEQAVQQFILADSLMALRLTMGEGGVLTYYQEMQFAYYDPLEAIYELKLISKDGSQNREINDLAFRFIERHKSFLLFREDILQGNERIRGYLKEIKKEAKKLNLLQADTTESGLINSVQTAFNYQKQLAKLVKEAKWKFNQKIEPIEDIQKKLRPNEFIVQYKAMQNDHFLVLAVGRDEVVFEKIDTTPNVQKLVNILNEKLSTSTKKDAYDRSSARLLYKKLISPFEKMLPDKDAELIIIPDHCLANFPFEALMSERKSAKGKLALDFLLNIHFVAYAPSWKVWNHNRNETLPNASHRIALFTYNNPNSLVNLPGEENEWEGVKAMFKRNAYKYEKGNCSKRKFISTASRYKIIHFSLHGESNSEKLKDNQLFFKIGTTEKWDTLNGIELSDLDLEGKFIVLSACKTNDGKNTPEGVYSLSRAFLQAGAACTVATLWSVGDNETSKIFNHFYTTYLSTDSPWVAISKAKRDYYRNSENNAPYFWAGIVATI